MDVEHGVQKVHSMLRVLATVSRLAFFEEFLRIITLCEIRDQCALSFAIGWHKRRKVKRNVRMRGLGTKPENLGCCTSESTLDEGKPAPVRWGTIDFLIR